MDVKDVILSTITRIPWIFECVREFEIRGSVRNIHKLHAFELQSVRNEGWVRGGRILASGLKEFERVKRLRFWSARG